MKTVGIATPQFACQGSTVQLRGTSISTPRWVTVFQPTGKAGVVEVEAEQAAHDTRHAVNSITGSLTRAISA